MLLGVLLLAGGQALAQQPPPLPPSEAFAAAMAPFNAARAQADDLTTADGIALGVGVGRASRDCVALTAGMEEFAKSAPEMLALGKLCIFGQQYEPARAAVVQYIALTEPKEHEIAFLLLMRAFLGMKAPGSALPQLRSLFTGYPYDAQIHYAADQLIDATAGASPGVNAMALEACGKQSAATLPLLASGQALPGQESNASAGTLFGDAVRCMTLARATGDISAAATLRQLEAIVELPAWQISAELGPMREALARVRMTGQAAPLTVLHGKALTAGGGSLARGLLLGLPPKRGSVVLVPFTLWAPSTLSILQTLTLSAPRQTFYAVTSWAANTGGPDASNPSLLAAMREFRKTLPAHTSLLIVPDAELKLFHDDAFPTGIVLREGHVAANAPLTGAAAVRLLLLALKVQAPN